MKVKFFVLCLLSAFGLVACAQSGGSGSPTDARVTGQERGGGDDTGLEFNQSLQQAIADLKTLAMPETATINYATVDQKLATLAVLVVSTPLQTTKDGVIQESAAANDPAKNQILVNRLRWHDLVGTGLRKALALHEFLSIMGFESTGRYPISTAYMLKLGVTSDPGFLESTATCIQTVVCSVKDPICVYIPGGVGSNTKTVLDIFVTSSLTCTDRVGHVETVNRTAANRYGEYYTGSDSGAGECDGHRKELIYSYPACPK